MPKSVNQRGKLLILLRILERETDEDHPLSVPSLVSRLESQGVSAERKSVYDNLNTLRQLGYDVVLNRGHGYYLGERDFELPELKLLADAVQSSRFITQHKAQTLISKLAQQTSRYEAQALRRQLYVAGRARSMNEQIYYAIDAIHQAINDDRKLSFAYFDYNVDREKVYRHDHYIYTVSPFALMRDSDNYYLVACDGQHDGLRHYRVDKMDRLTVTDQPREGKALFEAADPATYADQHFGMFRGEETDVLLRCRNEMAHVLIDRFGDNLIMGRETDATFTATVRVAVSPQFFGWLFGLGGGAVILGPAAVREEMERCLREQTALYERP